MTPDIHQPEQIREKDAGVVAKPKLYRRFFTFVIRHRLILSAIAALMAAAATAFYLVPEISVNNYRLVNIGVEVKLQNGEIARLKNTDVSAMIKHFTNDVCPEAGKCFGSSMAVEYELIIDGKSYATGSTTSATGAEYQIETVSTDYKTYAIIKIIKS